jgi:hypothetical protein
MIPLFPHGSANFNAKSSTYGARGNGTGDDTAALQACITAARGDVSAWYPNPSNPPDQNDDIPEAAVGSTAFIPRGDYVITSSLVLENAQFTRIWCEPGTNFIWNGPSDQDVFILDGTANWLVNANIVIPSGYSAASGVKITGRIENNPITSNCGLWRVTVTGECVRAFSATNIGAAATANNEAHIFSDCRAVGYTESFIHFRGNQVHKMHIDHCVGDGQGVATYFINCEFGAYLRADNCRSTGHTVFCYFDSVLIVNALQGNWSIEDGRLLVVGSGASGTATGLYVSENYCDHGAALNADRRSIIINTTAPTTLHQNFISATSQNVRINHLGVTNQRFVPMSGNIFNGPNTFTHVDFFPSGTVRTQGGGGGGGNLFNGVRTFTQCSRLISGFGFDGAAPTWNGYGVVELAAGDTFADVVFEVEEDDADYLVVSLAIEQLTGTAGALKATADSKTVTGFRINLNSAVPVGCTIAIGWMIARADV